MKRLTGFTAPLLLAFSLGTVRADEAWISSPSVRAQVSRDYPRVLRYERVGAGASFEGAALDARWQITLLRPNRTEMTVAPADVKVTARVNGKEAAYDLDCSDGGARALTFGAKITVEGDQVVYRLSDIRATGGYRLRQVDFGRALRVAMEASAPQPSVCGGNLGRDAGAYFLENPLQAAARSERSIDLVMLCQKGAVAAGYDNLPLHPWRLRTGREGAIGEFWCPPYVRTVVAGAGDNYTAGETDDFICRIGIVGDRSGDGQVDWRDGAAFIRDSLPGGMPLFQEYTRYEVGEDFDQFIDTARRISNITDGRPQLGLHAAWQYWGWDSEYPAYMEPSDELGGRSGLYRLMREAPKYRCLISLIHNFDDAYKSSPAWNDALVMRRSDGSLVEATAWAGGRSFIIGPFKEVKLGWARKVIDGLVAQGARARMFSDVLSAVPERVDEDPAMPSDALANLVLGKYEIIRMLRERGIVIGSESVTWPFVGRICTAHSMPLGISDNPNEVPLGPFVLHGKMAYQAWSAGPDTLLAGADDTCGWDNDRLYLWSMVLERYAQKPMTNYTRQNGLFRTEFGPGTFVEWRRGDKTARVTVDGRLIHNGDSSFLPKSTPGVFLAYSRSASAQRYPLPKGWIDPTRLLVFRLSDGPEKRVDAITVARFDGSDIVLTLEPKTPYRLCYGRDAYFADRRERTTPFGPPAITWPEDRVISSTPAGPRPDWIRKATRKEPAGVALYVGCGAKSGTEEASRQHAASIVARKIAWQVRQGFVGRSRDYERQAGVDTGSMGFDNWNLGVDEPLTLYSYDRVMARKDARWYVEKLEDHSPELSAPRTAYKAFVCVPITPKELHDVYLASIRDHLAGATAAMAAGQGNQVQLAARVKVWTLMLDEESKKQL